MENLVKRLEASVSKIEASVGGASVAGAAGAAVSPLVAAFDEIFSGDITGFLNSCRALGDDYKKIADLAEVGFTGVRNVLLAASKVKKPSDEALMTSSLFAAAVGALQSASSLPDNRSKAFNHQSAFVEFFNCIQWVLITPAPKPFVQGCKDSADFYFNKILKAAKDDPLKDHHKNFVTHAKGTLDALGDYIKQFHTTGLTWSATGVELSAYKADGSAAAPAAAASAGGGSIEDRLAHLADKLDALSYSLSKKKDEVKSDSDETPSVAEFDSILNGPVKEFVSNAAKLGGDIAKLGELTEKGFSKLRVFIVAASKCAKPSDDELGAKFGEIAEVIQSVKPDNRSKVFFHQSAYAEHIQILQWILVSPAPRPFAQGTVEASDFYLNKILVSTKDDANKNEHRAFVKLIKDITSETCEYIKKHHATGLSWKNGGQKFADFKA